jgi:hypothetical protein
VSRFYAPAILSRVSQVVGGGGGDGDGGMPEEKNHLNIKLWGRYMYTYREANNVLLLMLAFGYFILHNVPYSVCKSYTTILSDWKYVNDGKDHTIKNVKYLIHLRII